MKIFIKSEVFWRYVGCLLFSFFIGGCASLGTYNPATGRNEFIFISTPAEVNMGRDIHAQLQQEFKFSSDPRKLERLNRIGQRLAQVSDRQDFEYHFYLIDKDELNAFTTPGGNIYMFRGLIDRLTSDDQIAGVLGHEIGHSAARHTVKKFQAAVGYNIVGSILLSQLQLENQAKQILTQGSDVVMNVIFSAYGRQDEYEADRLGIKYMHYAGYNMQGMIETLELLERESKGPNVPVILRTHPYLKDRIIKVKEEIGQISNQETK